MKAEYVFPTALIVLDAHPTDFEQLINNTILQFLSSRESSKTCPKTGGDFGQFGNAAKLREALDRLAITSETFLRTNSSQSYEDTIDALDKARAALAAPPRNCDVGTAEEQSVRMAEFCREQYKKTDGVRLCSCCRLSELEGTECQFAWAQMPYEEGGAK